MNNNNNLANFFYKGKVYPVDLYSFSMQSDDILEYDENISFLITEFENEISDETIESFFSFFQQQQINITTSNVLTLNYLSNKYRIPKLLKLTQRFINKNKRKILDKIFSSETQISIEIEDFIASNFLRFIDDDRLLKLSISQHHRIINKYIKGKNYNKFEEEEEEGEEDKDESKNNKEIKIIDFLLKLTQKFGQEAKILFSLFKFNKNGRKYLNEKLCSSSELFNFDFAVSNLILKSIDNDEDHHKQEIKIRSLERKIDFLEKQFEREKKEHSLIIKKMKEDFENKYNELSDLFLSEISKIRNEMEKQQAKANKKTEQLNKVVFDINSVRYFREIFNKQNGESQMMAFIGFNENNPENKIIQNITNLLKYLSEEHQKSNHKYNQTKFIKIKFNDDETNLFQNKNNQTIYILPEAFEILLSNNTMNSEETIKLINNFDEIHIKIELPSIVNNEIIRNITEIKKLTEFNIIIDTTLTKIDENDKIFQYNNFIKTVEIKQPENNFNYEIEESFFEGCYSLEKVSIQSGFIKIKKNSFKMCENLKEITIPSSVTTIEESAFEECSSLTRISFENHSSLKSIGSYSFSGCSSLMQISIPSSVTTIGSSAFFGCSSLMQISIPSSVTEIGYGAFNGIKILDIAGDINTIHNKMFYGCISLNQISIPSSVTSIGIDAFCGCSSLTKISIPSSVTEIGDYAFSRCSSLKQMSIPSSVTSIGDYAFYGCSSLSQISIPTLEKIKNLAIQEKTQIIQI